jgi:hypothetical protein
MTITHKANGDTTLCGPIYTDGWDTFPTRFCIEFALLSLR